MTTLLERLPLPQERTRVLDDCCALIDREVKKKKGLKGLAVGTAYKILKAIKPGAVRDAVDGLLDDFLAALERFHADSLAAGDASFGQTIKQRAAEVAEALVQVTDRRAEGSKHKALLKMYRKLRPSAINHVQEALPGLAELMDQTIDS